MAIQFYDDGGGLAILFVGGLVAMDPACCCGPSCCVGELISEETVLVAELTSDGTGCFTLNNTMCMDDGVPGTGIWTSANCHGAGFFGQGGWKGLTLTCGENDELTLAWDSADFCPNNDTSAGANWTWRLVSWSCDPFEWVFEYDIDETGPPFTPGCNCDGSTSIPGTVVGTVQVTITIQP